MSSWKVLFNKWILHRWEGKGFGNAVEQVLIEAWLWARYCVWCHVLGDEWESEDQRQACCPSKGIVCTWCHMHICVSNSHLSLQPRSSSSNCLSVSSLRGPCAVSHRCLLDTEWNRAYQERGWESRGVGEWGMGLENAESLFDGSVKFSICDDGSGC